MIKTNDICDFCDIQTQGLIPIEQQADFGKFNLNICPLCKTISDIIIQKGLPYPSPVDIQAWKAENMCSCKDCCGWAVGNRQCHGECVRG